MSTKVPEVPPPRSKILLWPLIDFNKNALMLGVSYVARPTRSMLELSFSVSNYHWRFLLIFSQTCVALDNNVSTVKNVLFIGGL